jgi:hypothetical protein
LKLNVEIGGGGHIRNFAGEGEGPGKVLKPGESGGEHPEGGLLGIIIDFIIIKHILNAVSDRGVWCFET